VKTSSDGRRLIEAFEGLFLKAYDDGEGVLTIGYGHTSAAGRPRVYPGQTITADRADSILSDDLVQVEMRVGKLIDVAMSQNEFDALVSFEFNTGDLGKSSIPAKIGAGRKDEAMTTLLQYVHGTNTGKVYVGLARRRRAEKMMFEGDLVTALKIAGVAEKSYDMQPKATAPPKPPPSSPTAKPQSVPASRPSIWAALSSLLASFLRRG